LKGPLARIYRETIEDLNKQKLLIQKIEPLFEEAKDDGKESN